MWIFLYVLLSTNGKDRLYLTSEEFERMKQACICIHTFFIVFGQVCILHTFARDGVGNAYRSEKGQVKILVKSKLPMWFKHRAPVSQTSTH